MPETGPSGVETSSDKATLPPRARSISVNVTEPAVGFSCGASSSQLFPSAMNAKSIPELRADDANAPLPAMLSSPHVDQVMEAAIAAEALELLAERAGFVPERSEV